MASTQTKLQELANIDTRKSILRMLREGNTIKQIAFPFEEKGGEDFVIDVLKEALTPDDIEPPFYLEKRQFSTSGFKAAKAFLQCKILDGEFSPIQMEKLDKLGIKSYMDLLLHENPPIPKNELKSFFVLNLQHQIDLPVTLTKEQLELLSE